MDAELEQLLKAGTFEPSDQDGKACTALGLLGLGLSTLPASISLLQNLRVLGLAQNQFSSLPLELSSLTGISVLNIHDNPIEELPEWITAFQKLNQLYLNSGEIITVKRAPENIALLPCWDNTKSKQGELSVSDTLRTLSLYATASTSITDPNSEAVTGAYADVMNVDFASQQFLGRGGYGTAYKVRLRKGVVAVKVLKTEATPGTSEYDELTHEARLMINLCHTNIIGLYAYGCQKGKVFYVMEYADGKSIWDVMLDLKRSSKSPETSGKLSFDKYILYSIHIVAGLKYLHSRNPPVEHRDLKPENILLCEGIAKISDFGISSARQTISRTTGFQGTFHYTAPEYFDKDKSFGPWSDMYSFGLVVWAMIAGDRPYEGLTIGQVSTEKLQQKTPPIPPKTSAKLASLMMECWKYEPQNRPSAASLEPKLIDIQKDPGVAVGDKPMSVKDMNTQQLVQYLDGMKVLKQFVTTITETEATGEDFMGLNMDALTSFPFLLSHFQAKIIMKTIEGLKQTSE